MSPTPFDPDLSLRLDALIIELDEQPNRMRRAWLRLYKAWLEREVPAWHPGARP